MFVDDPMAELDYKYCFTECKTLDELKEYFLRGNWAIRQGFTYKSLAFINQENGGDEWWTVKKFPDGQLVSFESISMRHILTSCSHPILKNPESWRKFDCSDYKRFECQKKGFCKYKGLTHDHLNFQQYIERMLIATKEQCLKLTY